MQSAELLECDFGGTFPFRPRLTSLGAYTLHYVDEGSGEPIVCLHGNPTWGYLYRRFVRPLAAHGRVVVPDHLGFGKSAVPLDRELTLADRVGHLEALLVDKLDLKGITLVMHDWGGPIGLGFAARHPQRVRRLVTANSWCRAFAGEAEVPPAWRELARPGIGEVLVQGLNAGIEGLLPAGMHRRELVTEDLLDAYRAPFPDFNSRRHALNCLRDLPVGATSPAAALLATIVSRVRNLDVRSLVVWGCRDPFLGEAHAEAFGGCLPHAEVEFLDDCGYLVPEDAPQQFLARIEAFLGT